MDSIVVTNLLTGEEQIFNDTIPSEAVISAYLLATEGSVQNVRKRYTELYGQIVWGKKTVALGDFCVFRNPTE